MTLNPKTRVATLIRRHTQVADLLGWHGLEVEDVDEALTLGELCREVGLNVDDLIEEIEPELTEDDEDDENEDDEDEDDEDDEDGDSYDVDESDLDEDEELEEEEEEEDEDPWS